MKFIKSTVNMTLKKEMIIDDFVDEAYTMIRMCGG